MFTRLQTEPGQLPRVTTISHFEATHDIQLSALGQPLFFQSNDARLIEAAADTFGRFRVPETSENSLHVQVYIRHPGGEQSAERAPQESDQGVVVFNQGHLVLLNMGGNNYAVADLRAGYAYAILTPEFAQDTASMRYGIIESLPQILLGGRGYVALHAACVVKDGVSILLCGSSGTGKSTLAFACLRYGFRILAEDVVQLQISDKAMRLWGIPWKFHLLPDSLHFFPELPENQPRIQSNGEWKVEIELDALYPGSTVTDASPGAVVFLERTTSCKPRLENLGYDQASRLFEPIWSWDIPWQPRYEGQLVKLIKQKTYRLQMNGTPQEAAALLDKIICDTA